MSRHGIHYLLLPQFDNLADDGLIHLGKILGGVIQMVKTVLRPGGWQVGYGGVAGGAEIEGIRGREHIPCLSRQQTAIPWPQTDDGD